MEVSTRQIGFKNLEYTLSALPIIPYLKLEGFATDGVQWEKASVSTTKIGADGKSVVNTKPTLYTATFSLLPTSNARMALDGLVNATTAKFGKPLLDYSVVLSVNNYTTSSKTVYSGGAIEEADAGDSANLDDGQGNKQYKFVFTDRVILPL